MRMVKSVIKAGLPAWALLSVVSAQAVLSDSEAAQIQSDIATAIATYPCTDVQYAEDGCADLASAIATIVNGSSDADAAAALATAATSSSAGSVQSAVASGAAKGKSGNNAGPAGGSISGGSTGGAAGGGGGGGGGGTPSTPS